MCIRDRNNALTNSISNTCCSNIKTSLSAPINLVPESTIMSTESKNELQTDSNRGGLFRVDQELITWFTALAPVVYIACTASTHDSQCLKTFGVSLALAVVLYVSNYYLIPQFKDLLIRAGLSGKDLNKPGAKEDKPAMCFVLVTSRPESMGIVSGATFLIAGIITQLFYTSSDKTCLLYTSDAADE
eukprot:TRINITY_DN998_c0_g1_i11.p1 TRINITY_DN998_c0_g1~~TRINITY_DN998_c0_g1_i11.p1  ORF type:complete len:187 (-),score=45.95 TRINITY_DN998_c0_g1_i11:57-617(-)